MTASEPNASRPAAPIDFTQGLRREHYLYFEFFARFTNAPLAALAHRGGLTANAVTVIGMALCLPAGALNILGYSYAALVVFHLFFVIDCVDGVLARATCTTSPTGGYLDDLAHAVFHTVFFLTAGIGSLRAGEPWLALLQVGAVLANNLLCWQLDLRQKFFPRRAPPPADTPGAVHLLRDLVIGSFLFPNIVLWLTALSWHRPALQVYLLYVLVANLAYTLYTAVRTVGGHPPAT